MLKILGLFETIIFYMLSYLIPKNKKLVIFGCRKGTSINGNPKIFYKYLSHNYGNSLELKFYDKNGINNDSSIITYGNSFKKYIYMLRAQYIIIDNCSFDVGLNGVFIGKFYTIQTWHGEPIKGIGFLSDMYISRRSFISLFFEKLEYNNYKAILSNYNTKKVMEGVFNDSKKVINIGLPRNDILTHPKILALCTNTIIKKYIEKLSEKYANVILFTPTFRETISNDYFTIEDCKSINNSLKETSSILLIKTHPNETRNFLGNHKYSNIKNITRDFPFDANEFLPFVEFVMTDYSSVYIDFLLTGKPIIWYQNDLHDYIENERGLLYKPLEVVIDKATAYNINTLISILGNMNGVVNSGEYREKYKILKQKFYGDVNYKISSSQKLKNILFPNI